MKTFFGVWQILLKRAGKMVDECANVAASQVNRKKSQIKKMLKKKRHQTICSSSRFDIAGHSNLLCLITHHALKNLH